MLEVRGFSLAHNTIRPIRPGSGRVLDGLAAGLADPGWPRRAPAIRPRRRPVLDVDAFPAEEATGA
ncbi:hypothetical protein OG439_45885 [Amycolatopsis sp. NBC_01307]|uniref:hypothetical protein n=1 Tax=Amycolatopsis sp. NBC_01307 TaxID=2903561 RepID=UPI002E136593|nr:hypothetical protein OG439_45885 [Amycolatopsis sp. NBC_01307]